MRTRNSRLFLFACHDAGRSSKADHINGQALTTEFIDHRQTLPLLPIGTDIKYRVIGPHLTLEHCRRLRNSAPAVLWSLWRRRADQNSRSCSRGLRVERVVDGNTSDFGYDAPHPGVRGTSSLLNNALFGAHYGSVRLPISVHRRLRSFDSQTRSADLAITRSRRPSSQKHSPARRWNGFRGHLRRRQ
jgi:hypothetical protein